MLITTNDSFFFTWTTNDSYSKEQWPEVARHNFYFRMRRTNFTRGEHIVSLTFSKVVISTISSWQEWLPNDCSTEYHIHDKPHLHDLNWKYHAWLLFSDRLNTRDMLRRRHWNVTDVFHCACFFFWRMSFTVCCVPQGALRIGCISFLAATLASGYGTIYRFTGSRVTPLSRVLCWQSSSLVTHSSLRLLFWLPGTFGNREMKLFFRMCCHLLDPGEANLGMRSPCTCIGWKPSTHNSLQYGLTLCYS